MKIAVLNRWITGLLNVILGCCLFAASALMAKVPDEYDVKLVYLFNFTKFITWSEQSFKNSDAPFTICVMGRKLSRSSISAMETKRTRNRPIKIVHVESINDNTSCQILFLTKSVTYPALTTIKETELTDTLIVGETPGFAKNNGEIGFVIDERNRVRIEINLDRANKKNISVRAQLLEIARKVYRDGEGA